MFFSFFSYFVSFLVPFYKYFQMQFVSELIYLHYRASEKNDKEENIGQQN